MGCCVHGCALGHIVIQAIEKETHTPGHPSAADAETRQALKAVRSLGSCGSLIFSCTFEAARSVYRWLCNSELFFVGCLKTK